jgi:phage/plasmid-associated DNA primase
MTGGDKMSARFMRGEFFDFYPCFKLWMFGNHKPMIKGSDFGIWRRLRLIPFEVQISEEEKDTHLLDKLKMELSHILAWAVEGCLLWQKEGLAIPLVISQAVDDYRDEMDIIGAFLKESTIQGKNKKEKASELYKLYQQHCLDNGEQSVAQKRFGQQLTERGFYRKHEREGWFWYGLAIGNPFDDDNYTRGGGEPFLNKNCDPCDPCDLENNINKAANFSYSDMPFLGSQRSQGSQEQNKKLCSDCRHHEKDDKNKHLCINENSTRFGQYTHVACEAFEEIPVEEF